MNDLSKQDMFEVTLSQEGAAYLLRLYKLTQWVCVLAIIVSLILLTNSFTLIYKNNRYYAKADWQTMIYPVYAVLASVITLTQFYCYFRFTLLCKKAIQLQQADLFNYSFKWLLRNTIFACCMGVLEILTSGYFTLRLIQAF
jgi:hypothetical protein